MLGKFVRVAFALTLLTTAWTANSGDYIADNGWNMEPLPHVVNGDVIVKDGGMFLPVSGIDFSTPNSTLSVNKWGHLIVMTGLDLTTSPNATVEMNGVLMVGNGEPLGIPVIDGLEPSALIADAIALGSDARLSLDHTLMMNYNAQGTDLTGLSYTFIDASSGSLSGNFRNLKANNTFVSLYGDFGIDVDDTTNTASITSYTFSDSTSIASNIVQLNKMGYHGNALSSGFLANLNDYANNFGQGATNLQFDEDTVAGTLNRGFFEALAGGLDYWAVNRQAGIGTDYFEFGIVDDAVLEYMSAATVNNVIHANQRSTSIIADSIYDRTYAIGDMITNIAQATGSDNAYASSIINRNYLNRFYVNGIGQLDRAKNRNGHSGYDYDGYGFSVGYDRMIGSSFLVGGSFSYVGGDYKEHFATGHDSNIKNHIFNVYSTYFHCSGLFATVVGGYNYADNNINENRGGWMASENYHSKTWYMGGKVGYNWSPVKNLTLTPSVGLGYINTHANGHDGYYAGVNNLKFSKMKNDTGFLPIEFRAKYDWNVSSEGVLSATVKGGYTYNFEDNVASGSAYMIDAVNAAPLGATGRKYGHNQWNIGAGINYGYKSWDFGASYQYVGQSKYSSHNANVTVGFKF